MKQYTQVVGERRIYRQPVRGDTIASADWSATPAGADVEPVLPTVADHADALFGSDAVGEFVLRANVTCPSGQILMGQVRVNVVELIV